MELDSNRHILVVENVTLEDTGWYTCTVGSQLGKTNRSAWVTVGKSTRQQIQMSTRA